MVGTEGGGGKLGGGRKTEEGCLRLLPPSSFLQQTLPSHLVIANYIEHLMSTYCVPGVLPSISQAASHLILQQSCGAAAMSYPHSTREETEAKRRPKVTWLVSG